jgi:tetratricopeptide (TPR) repeat protein
MTQPPSDRLPFRVPPPAWATGAVVLVATAVVAWARVGLLGLPSAPAGLTLERSGLAELSRMKRLNDWIWASADQDDAQPGAEPAAGPATASVERLEAARLVRRGRLAVEGGDVPAGLEQMRRGIELAPDDLVLGNAYRMVAFSQRRAFLNAAKQQGSLTPEFPPHLDRQPIAYFEGLDRRHPCRETKLQLALAWVDEMLLFPALEIKAPASVEAVDILTRLLEGGEDAYVPALFARGLNHLHRPARLVWPESRRTAPDAAAQDIGKCVAIGRKLGAGSPKLQATLAMALGDAYVKAGRFGNARSWWQIAQNLCRDRDVHDAVFRRYGWPDEQTLDRLEEELDRCRSELDHPMTDLAMMWN